ncbi:MAG: TIGR03936 family radical SAM-associated protein [Treponema sp.]|nr:TIGR03936 family radical SAM-associated protein [Treponema sp.]
MNCRRYINPLDFGKQLLGVEKPVRYVGGEYGRLARKSAALQTVIAFPDLYEIGMSNQALRIIYNRLNSIDDVSCDRAFMPAPDFREFLKRGAIPLYGLDTGVALGDVDVLMFTLGYELGITNVLAMLELAGVPIHADERKKNDSVPIVIMGGPCVSNPLPYARFIDAFWIGEAEAGFFELMERLAALKMAGAGKAAALELAASHHSVWTGEDGRAPARRAVDAGFSRREAGAAVFPIPNMKVVQHHGAVEIMRGCPNGCRFCHAGYWYRPMRQKPAEIVEKEAAAFIKEGGYHEISLSSLSSGDYNGLEALIDRLNAVHARDHISFQLPSLRVSTFSLPLLDKISTVRKSGLTFAIETPVDSWQMMINKDVSRENVVNILLEAKKKGWRGAKFYFMIGLPVNMAMEGGGEGAHCAAHCADEEVEIVAFTLEVARRTNMHFNVNVGTFIPKPHTPFQWAKQLDEATSRRKLEFIRNKLQPLGHKVGVQDAFISVLEGVLSRGDDRVGEVIEDAFNRGCLLDAWSEYLNKDAWRATLEDHKALVEEIFEGKDVGAERSDALPWQNIGAGMAKGYLSREMSRSKMREFTSICIEKCNSLCGNCNKEHGIVKNIIHDDKLLYESQSDGRPQNSAHERPSWRIVFSFSKKEEAVFYSHLSLMEIFYMAFLRAGIPVQYSRGFNPLPKLEIAAPLSIGIAGNGEIASIDTRDFFDSSIFVDHMNRKLPKGLRIADAIAILIPIGEKKRSLSSLLWGYEYKNNEVIDVVPACDEKEYRRGRVGEAPAYGLERLSVLAKDICGAETGKCYFEVYKALYPAACGTESGVDKTPQP